MSSFQKTSKKEFCSLLATIAAAAAPTTATEAAAAAALENLLFRCSLRRRINNDANVLEEQCRRIEEARESAVVVVR